ITITGSNDVPVLAADASGPHTTIQAVQTSGTLTFTDVDLTDQHTASTSVTSTIWPLGVTPPSGIDAVLGGARSGPRGGQNGCGGCALGHGGGQHGVGFRLDCLHLRRGRRPRFPRRRRGAHHHL